MNEEYVIRRASRTGNGGAEKWDSSFWDGASELELSYVFPESSSNRPETRIKMLYDDSYIYGRFRVSGDLAVAAAATVDQQMVCRDSLHIDNQTGGDDFSGKRKISGRRQMSA